MNDSNDPFNLQRFVDSQDPCFERVCSELRDGRKTGHWMWFIFPQIKGLGHSPLALKYAISSREEAEAYSRHLILGPRLRECTRLVNLTEGRSIEQIFGYPVVSFLNGGMGVVYICNAPYGQIAAKTLRPEIARIPEAEARFRRESEAWILLVLLC